ncbi:MAG: UDP-2,3-diacylglucosamine diphosphatase [Saprospirales bacterium]|nr:MAG: UDP-2,3-diacylglucosamine diphosphatase [Saprospirales bacterium]
MIKKPATLKKIYFASDFHLGLKTQKLSARERELIVCNWLDHISDSAEEILLVGDLFDFWFEYSSVVPKGFTRFLGKLAEISDSGVPVSVFTGNHDLWMFGYFEEELGVNVFHSPQYFEWYGKKFLVGHGDGLGPGDKGYKRVKKVFTNRFCQLLFSWLHPNIGVRIAHYWSGKSRESSGRDRFLGPDSEWLIQYSERKLQYHPEIDFFIFGHRHLPIDHTLSNGKSRYVNLGDWLKYFSYAEFDGKNLSLLQFDYRQPSERVFLEKKSRS